ncbi:hypothetical protein CASFOL_026810 [Castilleja foliolosa]|uniref:SOSEKI DIX-like domain-containing protein n=1 Tax=Castilleja foliolosa TaxID=1961234 RepID=A0ABD3CI42_9LAMI
MAERNKPWRDDEVPSQIGPQKTKAWAAEPPPKLPHHMNRVPVVYYLSKNGQLQHPHFMEVPLSSPHGLFLQDVINRLNVLRGKGMPAMYSWACKRSYKNGYVWHDLSENDFIHPAHGHEYVLKGSELPETEEERPPPPPPENTQLAPDRRRRNQSCSSIDFNLHDQYNVYKVKHSTATDVSTQTGNRNQPRIDHEIETSISISPPESDSSPETLGTLMKVDRTVAIGDQDKQVKMGLAGSRSSVLMQLISCGSVSFKDCGAGRGGLGLIGQIKMRVPRGRGKLEEKEYFSGSLVDTKKEKIPALKRSTSYTADR